MLAWVDWRALAPPSSPPPYPSVSVGGAALPRGSAGALVSISSDTRRPTGVQRRAGDGDDDDDEEACSQND
eukprot:1316278-Pyramimonas_sp.AAC.1